MQSQWQFIRFTFADQTIHAHLWVDRGTVCPFTTDQFSMGAGCLRNSFIVIRQYSGFAIVFVYRVFMWCGLFMMNSNDTSDRAHTKTHWNFYFRFWIRLNFISLLRQRPARFYYVYSSTEFRWMWRLIFIVVIINELRLIENYVNSGRDRLTSECRDESMVIQQMIILLFFACRWYNHYIVFSNSFFPLFLLLVPHECVGRDEIVNWMNAIRLALMPKVIKINLFWKSRRVWDLIARDDGARMFFDAPQTSGEWQHVAGRISALSLGAIRAQY